MKNVILTCVFAVGLFLVTVPESQAQVQLPEKIQKQIKPNQLPRNIVIPANVTIKKGMDLVAADILFSIVAKKDKHNAIVKIEGIVKNSGSVAYTSGVGQQTALLYEEIPGVAPKLVASQNFQNVAAGGTVKVAFERKWNRSSSAEGEFPPTYILMIVFDPDIYIDGNEQNNDPNTSNNRLSKSASAINSLTW